MVESSYQEYSEKIIKRMGLS